MKKEEYINMYNLEDSYWWFVGKRFLIDKFLKRSKKNNQILDVGCGTGIIMKMMQKYGTTYGIDASKLAIDFCKKRNLKNLKLGKIESLPYKNNQFDIVTCLDLLYHKEVKDDLKALKELSRVLKKGGRLLITDSAMMCLYGKHDKAHHGIRRYSREELEIKLKKAGFSVEKITYYNTLLFPFVYLKRKLDNLNNKKIISDVQKINPITNYILKQLFIFEISLLSIINYPFGVTIFAIAKKK